MLLNSQKAYLNRKHQLTYSITVWDGFGEEHNFATTDHEEFAQFCSDLGIEEAVNLTGIELVSPSLTYHLM